jgi:hypothetical protein
MPTTIAVSPETKELLQQTGKKGESYDTIIRHLLHEAAWKRQDAHGNSMLEQDEFIPLDVL